MYRCTKPGSWQLFLDVYTQEVHSMMYTKYYDNIYTNTKTGQAREFDLMLVYCWASVTDADPEVNQHCWDKV